ncbi:putative IMPACT (imprinted ancient) family translation regulator, partial [Chitinophagaceae bacterium OAS944]|nr:putative IMPACT (imprinted ancient) family translation regulator [Chitinophagaceae bacterium OAS944]
CANQLPYTWNGNTYNTAGTYKDTLLNAAGCDSIVTLTLNVNPAVTGSQTARVCANQLPYTWNGNIYNVAGTYKDTLLNAAGCDSIVTLTLNVNPAVTGSQTATICANQLPYTWNGNAYNAAGTYKDTLVNAAGCDSIATLTLNVNPAVTGSQSATICANQLPYTWNGNTYNTAGTYKDTLLNAAGCDSIVTLTLNVNPVVTGTESATVCANQLPYTWNGNTYNTAGTYKDTLLNAAGCDSIVTLTLNINPAVTGSQTATICANQLPYSWNGNTYNAAGTYKDTLANVAGCDSIVTLTLNVNPAVTGSQTATICANQLPYSWNGNTYNAAGTYKDTLVNAAGCDSIVTLTLNVTPTVSGSQTATICANQLPYSWNGNTYNAAGTYKDTLVNAAGCDSIITLTLNINPAVTGSQTATICANQLPYTWNGNTYNAAATYKDTLVNAAGCDSIVTLTLNVSPAVTGSHTATVCANQLPYTWNGNIYNAAGTYKDTLVNAAGCDSIVTLTLNVNPAVTGSQTATICANQLPYTWNGNTYNAAGTYKDTLVNAAGCDSIVTLTLNVNPAVTGSQTATICANQLPYNWNGNTYNTAGTYKDTLVNAAGCDSIVTLTLNINPAVTGSQTATICANQLPYSWNGNTYNAAGTYKDTLLNAAGCDSIVTLTLNINPAVTGSQTATICANQLPYTWNSNTYNTAGTYKDTLLNAAGCDSIVTLTLNVSPAVTGSHTATVCANQLPYTWNGNIYNAAGTYKDTLVNAAGCDSIVTLTLNVNPAVTGSQTATICANQLPYTWNGNTYNAAGTYKDTLVNAAGCDSIVTLTLNVNPAVTGSQTATICANQLPYSWNGNTYNAAGTYKDTLINAAGCDSIVTLTLNVNPAVTGSQTATICANQLPYIWNGNTYNAAGTYKDTLANVAGCDSIVTLTLNVNPAVTGSQTATICANQLPYIWNGNTYNAAGTYKDTLANVAGCDSIVTLTLNVSPAVTGSQTATICANQLPYTWNGNTYNTAGTYKDTLVNAAGCDSIVTLTLNVNQAVTGSQTATICSNQLPYTWNGNTHNAAGTYKDTLVNAAGCDSIVTLTLNVNPAVTGSQTATICANQLPYTWNSNTYNTAGTYKDTLLNAAGCDSIVTLTLNVSPAVTGSHTATVCANQLPYTWNGNIYNAAGTYKDTLVNAAGCDSIVTLTLNVNPAITGSQTATICANQLPYTWNGNSYNSAGTYKDTLFNAAGCDSIVTLTLNVNPAVTGSQTATICANQLPYSWNGNTYNAAGTYKDTLVNTAGCDSIATLTLNVNPAITGSQTAKICANQLPYTWNGNTYNAAGTYKDTLTSASGCDSIVTLTLNVNPAVIGSQTTTICANQLPYTWHGNTYNAAGTYKDTLVNAAGCDSIVTLTLNVNPAVTGSQTATICANQLPYNWNGNTYNSPGSYKDTLLNAAGCDSIVTLTLNVNPAVIGSQTTTICANQLPYTWNGNTYNAAGTYKDTLVNTAGCDSIVTLTLNVNPAVIGSQTATICANQLPYSWNGNTYNAAGTYKDTLLNAAGCDSIVTLTLNINPAVTGSQTATICANQLPYSWNGNTYNAAGTYKDTLANVAGCDSIVTLTLNVNPAVTGSQTATICANQLPYSWNGNTYNAAGTYKDTLVNAAGCDSIVTLTLNVSPAVTGSHTATVCANQLPYTWNGNIYNAAGTYKDTLVNAAGCDSIVTLTLNVNPAVTGLQTATICANQLPYSWNGNTYNAAGTYKDTLINAAGCDSIVTLTLNVNPAVTGSQTATICANQLPYTWNGNTYNIAGNYKDTLVNAAGCDSVVTLNLIVNNILRDTTRATVCTNQLPFTWNGTQYNAAGAYRDTLTSSRGCDSIINLILTVNSVLRDTTRATVCTNQLPYTWNGNTINTAGTYRDTLTSSRGCDSIINLILTVNSVLRDTTRATVCTNQLPYTWNGTQYNAAGTYRDTLTSRSGCDSIINLILTVNSVLRDTTKATVCTNQLPYNWNGTNINAAGTYRDTLTSRAGCDSITNLILTVNSVLRDTTRATVCTNQLPYNWNGTNINTAGTYRDTLTSRSGCDSIINLILTVNSVLRDTTRATVCTNQLPYKWNGTNINAAGTYRDTLTSRSGCDSIINLILTVNSVLRDTTRATVCTNQLPYRWNGININAAGTYTDTLTSRAGCDSIINLILTVNSVLRDTTRATVCTNQLPYNWNGTNINTAGTYRDTLTSRAGCDSIINLILTVNNVLRDTTRATVCTNQLPYNWNGTNINAAGTYRDTLTSRAGCDSIINLILTVNSVLRDTTRATICTNQLPYSWNGTQYNAAGTYRDTLTSRAGCDSIVNLILTVNSILRDTTRATICTNQLPYNWNGTNINAAGTYRDTLTNSAGCDSIINLILTVNSVLRDTTRVTVCTNQLPYRWNGTNINIAGTYKDTLTSRSGCDSIINLILTVNSVLRDTTRTTICTNQLPYTWNGNTINTAGTYRDTLISRSGCDSIINLILTINNVLRDTTRATVCTNQLPYNWNGTNINTAGTYRDTLTSRAGCDSIINLILTVNNVLRDTTRATICTNQLPYNWNGTNINAPGTYKDTLTSRAGCDSIINLILTINSVLRDTTRATVCTNQLPYNWNGTNINAAGTYRDTLTSRAGCDSIINLILTLNSVLRDTTRTTICTNQLPYRWNGTNITAAGTYRDTLTSRNGCDSITTLILTVNSVLRDTTRATICTNQLPYRWNSTNINAAGTYRDTLTSRAGCDSIINLILTVNTVLRDTTRATICTNQLPYRWNGTNINAAGTYRDTLTSRAGCDSIINLILTVNNALRDTTRATICTNQLPYRWNGTNINAAGTYRDTLTSRAGCDSIVNLILTVNNVLRDTTRATVCTNQLPYNWNGTNINAAGTYRDTLTSRAGCDSIINLILTVNSILRDTTRATICTNQLPYRWNGINITAAGTYRDTLTSRSGCDSITNLILTVNNVLRDTTRSTICTNQLP